MNKFAHPRVLLKIAAFCIVINGLFPAVWILLTSLKTEVELTSKPITWWPASPTLESYQKVFIEQPLLHYFTNSLIVACASTLLSLFVATLAAYALARLNLRYRKLFLGCIVMSSMFPIVTILVPLFETMRAMDLLNTYTALILPYTVLNLPICTLVLVSFFESIPRSLESAAMIDGCSRLGALWHIVLPLSSPGVFTAGILAFVNAWDEFLLALSLNAAQNMRTLPVGIALYQGEYTFPWPVISAALIIAIMPVVFLVVAFQDRIVAGLTAGGIKG